jgi:hypothetical protein
MVGRRRENEDEAKYIKRVANTLKYIRTFSSAIADSEVRKMYVDSQDANMFYNTDFDYEQYRKDIKEINDDAKGLPIAASGQQKEGFYEPTPEEFWKMGFLQGMASSANQIGEVLLHPMKCNWDGNGAEERKELYNFANLCVRTFKSLESVETEKDIKAVLSEYVEGANQYTRKQLKKAGVQNVDNILMNVDALMQARKDLIERRKKLINTQDE